MKSLWKFLNGKKRTIALIYWTVIIPTLAAIYPDGAPEAVGIAVTTIGSLLSALGLGHAAIKGIK